MCLHGMERGNFTTTTTTIITNTQRRSNLVCHSHAQVINTHSESECQPVRIDRVSFCRVREVPKSDYFLRHACLSVRPHGPTRVPVDGFLLHFTFQHFSDMEQMIIWRMRFACWITKPTDTHSEYELNNYCFSTTTRITRTRLGVTLYLHCLSCLY